MSKKYNLIPIFKRELNIKSIPVKLTMTEIGKTYVIVVGYEEWIPTATDLSQIRDLSQKELEFSMPDGCRVLVFPYGIEFFKLEEEEDQKGE